MATAQRRLLPSTSALSAFESVARLGSFSAAAEELALTQGAISRQIALLEGQLGLRLFDRGARGVSLTPEGRTYAHSIAEALAIIRSASLEAMTGSHGNTLNLAVLPTFGTRWLMPHIKGFIEAHPGITLNFATRIGQFDFEAEGLDAAIHVGQPVWPGADCTFLMHETVEPVCSPQFLKDHPVATADDLSKVTLLHLVSRPGAWEHWFQSLGLRAPVTQSMRFEQFATAAQACIAGLGVALLPRFLIGAELQAQQLVRAFDHPVLSPSSYYLVAPRAKSGRAPVSLFRTWLLSEMARDQAMAGVDSNHSPKAV